MFNWPQFTWRSFKDRPAGWLIFFGLILPFGYVSYQIGKHPVYTALLMFALGVTAGFSLLK